MDITIEIGGNHDFEWLKENDIHAASPAWIQTCLQNKHYYIAFISERPVGFLRFSYFWGSIPYMDMIRVNENLQSAGIGSKLVRYWEKKMKDKGMAMCMTSAQLDEPQPTNWHIKNGYRPSGQIHFWPTDDYPEIFMIKKLT